MEEIKDFGEKIGGARKELYKLRGLILEDLYGLTDKEVLEQARKDNIWVKPNYAKMKDRDPECVYLIKLVRDAMKSSLNSRYGGISMDLVKLYIEYVSSVRDWCMEKLIHKEDIARLCNLNSLESGFPLLIEQEGEVKLKYPSSIRSQLEVHSVTNVILNYSTPLRVEKLSSMVKVQGFPDNYHRELNDVYITQERGTGKYILRGINWTKLYRKINTDYNISFDTEEELVKFIRETIFPAIEGNRKVRKKSTMVNIVRPVLERIERVGPNIRNGKDATPEMYLNQFNLRGGEFGNWNSQKDRIAYLNYGFDAFVDLSYAIDMPLSFIGLGKLTNAGKEALVQGATKPKADEKMRLAIAFGSRGVPNANAHYEPDKAVINLTKIKGAGSLAHEFGHALDDYIGSKLGIAGILKALSMKFTKRASRYVGDKRDLRPEELKVIDAMQGVFEELNDAQYSKEEAIIATKLVYKDKISEIDDELNHNIGKTLNMLRALKVEVGDLGGPINKLYIGDYRGYKEKLDKISELCYKIEELSNRDMVTYYLKKAKDNLQDLVQASNIYTLCPEENLIKHGESLMLKYAHLLDNLNGKQYYALPLELFARIFESYVEDTLHKKGVTSEYLVHSTHNDAYSSIVNCHIYPDGAERERFNRRIESLLVAIKDAWGSEFLDNRYSANNYGNKEEFKSYLDSIYIDKEGNKDTKKEAVKKESKEESKDAVKKESKDAVKNVSSSNEKVGNKATNKDTVKNTVKNVSSSNEKVKGNNNKIVSTEELRQVITKKSKELVKLEQKDLVFWLTRLIGRAKEIGYKFDAIQDVYKSELFKNRPFSGDIIVLARKDKLEKQVEYTIKYMVTHAVLTGYPKVSNSIKILLCEAYTMVLCRLAGLDVRTYLQSELAEALVKSGNAEGFVQSLSGDLRKVCGYVLKV